LRDIFGERHEKSRHALRSRNKRDIVPYPDQTAILTSILLFDLELFSFSLQQLDGKRPIGFAVVRMGDVKKREGLELLLGVTQHLLVDAIGGEEAAVEVRKRHTDGRIVKDGPPSLGGPAIQGSNFRESWSIVDVHGCILETTRFRTVIVHPIVLH